MIASRQTTERLTSAIASLPTATIIKGGDRYDPYAPITSEEGNLKTYKGQAYRVETIYGGLILQALTDFVWGKFEDVSQGCDKGLRWCCRGTWNFNYSDELPLDDAIADLNSQVRRIIKHEAVQNFAQ